MDEGGDETAKTDFISLQTKDIDIAPIGNRFVFHNRSSGAVVLSNLVGAKIIKKLLLGQDFSSIVSDLTPEFNEPDEAVAFLDELLSSWSFAGLFGSKRSTPFRGSDRSTHKKRSATYELGNRRFQLISTSKHILDDVNSLFEGYLAANTDETPADTLTVSQSFAGHVVHHNSVPIWRPCSADEARFLVVQKALSFLAGPTNVAAVFHAAAVIRNNKAVLLAGPSGKGKTTLALLLAERGWAFAGDDMIALQSKGGGIISIPLAARMKNRRAAQVHSNQGETFAPGPGIFVKPGNSAPIGEVIPVSALVFPCFSAGAFLEEQDVKPELALERLLKSGTEIMAPHGRIRSISDLLNRIPIRSWTYGDNESAFRAMQNLTEENLFEEEL